MKVRPSGRKRVIRSLRRNRHELRPKLVDLGQDLLVGPKLQVAVRAPTPAIESDDKRSAVREHAKIRHAPKLISKLDVGELIT